MISVAVTFPSIPVMAYGPGLFPKIVAGGLILSGIGIVAEAWTGRAGAGDAAPMRPLPVLARAAIIAGFALAMDPPSVYVVMRPDEEGGAHEHVVFLVTASPYEAQDYADTGEELVEKVPMSAGVLAWVTEFVDTHYEEEVFVKRKRKNARVDQADDGIGDPRIRQTADVYRAPSNRETVH